MEQITKEHIKQAIHSFLQSQYNSKTEKEQKQLVKAREDSDYATIEKIQEKLGNAKEKYSLDVWMDNAANKMAKQLHFGTHISKGIHPDSKGDNISYFVNSKRNYVGSHNVKSSLLDANGNAAALPLAAFFDYFIDGGKQVTIRDAILSNVDGIETLFSNDQEKSESFFHIFYKSLRSEVISPVTHERNKQMLWPINNGGSYINIVPLYPSVFTHTIYNKLNNLRFSEENKAAKENRFKKTAENKAYLTVSSIAVTKLGGTKPQNISSLLSKQVGRNYLLPSLPPQFKQSRSFKIQPYAESLFSKGLEYRCKDIFAALATLIKTQYNNVNIRNARKDILDNLLYKILAIAGDIQEEYPAGWSKEYSLHISEKYWLDPKRTSIDKDFSAQKMKSDWQKDISDRFASWVNHKLRQQLKNKKHELADAEHLEWQKEMREMMRDVRLQGVEVFK